ncbi:MAG TPA: hypothetical protein PLP27_05595 [Crocinitomicaceae bacterium]|nr:hypothetical protein [Crocinitomicaceae bacterium]
MNTTTYISICGSIGVEYIDGVFNQLVIIEIDKISFDVLRHDFELFEEDIDLTLFVKQ